MESHVSADRSALDPTSWRILTPAEAGHSLEGVGADLPVAQILVADARPEMRAVVDLALGERYACEFASTVEQAGEMLANGSFELVICDVNAEGEAGLTLASLASAGYPGTAVVLITDEDNPTVAEKAFALDVHGYLLEPLRPGQLLITTINALRRRELEIASRAHSRNLENRVQKIIDMAPMPIYAKDVGGRYVVANAQADEISGVGRGELTGMTDGAIMSSQSAIRVAETDRLVLDCSSKFKAEEVRELAGVARVMKIVKFPIFDEGGEVVAVGGVSTDITAESEAIQLRDELAVSQQRAIEDLRLSRQETVERLTRAIDRHDSSTGEHVTRMAAIVALLGTKMNLDPGEVELMSAAAPMHDVGKIAMRDEILRKPGSLTEGERTEMQGHTLIGYEILVDSHSELLQLAASIALTHHERYDGAGYPQSLMGREIPLAGRVAAVADVFDALLTDRVYRPAMSVEGAVAVMRKERGRQFDPEIVDILLDNLDEALALRKSG